MGGKKGDKDMEMYIYSTISLDTCAASWHCAKRHGVALLLIGSGCSVWESSTIGYTPGDVAVEHMERQAPKGHREYGKE